MKLYVYPNKFINKSDEDQNEKTIQGIGFSSHPKYAGKFSYPHETYETCTNINRLEEVRSLSRANNAD
jgi:hypothetical protein